MQRKVIGQGVLFLFAGLSLVWNVSADEPPPTPTVETGPIGIQIVGGQPASTGEYPWMAALVSSTVANPQQGQFCGGSLVTPQWVVTAAHCVTGESASTIDVVVGINNLSSGPTTGSTGQRRKVSQIIVHPAYNSATDDSDIALLRLVSAVTTNSTVSPITPLGPGTTWADPGDMATVTGWGATSSGGASSNALLEVDLPIVSNTTCNNAVGGITANMLCAGYAAGGKDSCQGDSGGPLIVPNSSGGKLLAGIVSWGEGCALPNKYGVYTRVSNFKSWIDGYTGAATATPTPTASATPSPTPTRTPTATPPGMTPAHFVYLPTILRLQSSGQNCIPDPPGDSDNIANALTICSGQSVSGSVNYNNDWDDVYKIQVEAGRQLTISMTGSGGDADLYLFPPGSTNLASGWKAESITEGNNEFIQYTISTPGYWYIDVYAYSGATTYNLTATVN